MPKYQTQCQTCEKVEERRLSFQEYDAVHAGSTSLPCSTSECSGSVGLVFDPAHVSFVLKDGESGGFVSKAMRENAYRSKRRKVMAQRERDHVRPNRLQPNFQGQVASSWGEARDAAYQSTYAEVKSRDGEVAAAKAATSSAKTYDARVKQEGT